ncbi:MAG: beta-propeller fold lactonase family protein [Streptosporangiales bacterium]|nr:beta-propeller fold lactonase family protein [Streptosporangiales bacterium]
MNGRRRATIAAGLATAATLVLSAPTPGLAGASLGGHTVYVTNSAVDRGTAASIARFAINAGGTLAPVDTMGAGQGARGMVFTPDLRFAYLSSDQIEMYRIGPDGALTRFGATESPNPFSIAITPNGRTVYVSSPSNDTLSVFAVRPDGGLTPRGAVDTEAAAPRGVGVTPDGRFLYVSHGRPSDTGPSVITGFAIRPDGTPGRRVAKADIGISGADPTITPNGRFLYVAHLVSNDVHGFRIGRSGALTPVPGSPVAAGDGPQGAATSPDGSRLYVTAIGAEDSDVSIPGEVLGFTIGPDGRLTESIDRIDMTAPIGIGFAPDGRHLYVSDSFDDIVNTFAVRRDGNLTLVQTLSSGGPQPKFDSVSVLPTRSGRASR